MTETPATETAALFARARSWVAGDPDPVTRAELRALLEQSHFAELSERMATDIEFGTAGLRGLVGAGSARMNLAVVLRVTRALAEQLLSRVPDARARPVVLGCDARLDSVRFADAAARVLLAAGIPVKRFLEPVPTPFVAHAVRAFAATAGVMITASHNPRDYNGYKLYWDNGVQVVPPVDREIASRMVALGPANEIPLGELGRQELIGPELTARYLAEIRAEMPLVSAPRELVIAYTPMHGVGAAVVERLFAEAGYRQFYTVAVQREPDGHFPTLPFPNPEEPGALDALLALATEKDADLAIANDPDVDRLAIAVPTPSGRWIPLTGNQIGLLLADFALSRGLGGERACVVSSLVSSPMLERIASSYGAHCERVLTGFKWICSAGLALEERGLRFAFGYEEALGYAFGRAVRDKDGISAALAFAELAAAAHFSGETVLDRLSALYRRHGLWLSVQHNVTLTGSSGAARIARAIEDVVASPPSELAGRAVTNVRDFRTPEVNAPAWRGAALLVVLELGDSGRVCVRPSGTEPKLKLYVDWRRSLGPEESLTLAQENGSRDAIAIADALVTALGLDSL